MDELKARLAALEFVSANVFAAALHGSEDGAALMASIDRAASDVAPTEAALAAPFQLAVQALTARIRVLAQLQADRPVQ